MNARLPHEAIAEWWGDELDATTIRRAASASLDEWALFAHSYQSQPAPQAVPTKEGRITAYCQLGSKADDLYDAAKLPLGPVRVRALALLAHTVVAPDPMDTLTRQLMRVSEWDEPPSEDERLRVLKLVASLRPLATDGALVYVRRGSAPVDNQLSDAVRELKSLWGQIPDTELDWRWVTDPRGVRANASGGLAAFEILFQLGQARHSAPDGALLIGTPLERSALQYMYRVSSALIPDRFGGLSTYAALPVPILVPEPSAVVSIREADEYARLREDLGCALAQVERISAEDESWLSQARQLMQEELAVSRRTLESSLSKDTSLARTRRILSALSFSALGAAAAAGVGGKPVPSVTAGAVTGVSSLLATFLSERRQVRERRAVLESYLMFDEAPSQRTSV